MTFEGVPLRYHLLSALLGLFIGAATGYALSHRDKSFEDCLLSNTRPTSSPPHLAAVHEACRARFPLPKLALPPEPPAEKWLGHFALAQDSIIITWAFLAGGSISLQAGSSTEIGTYIVQGDTITVQITDKPGPLWRFVPCDADLCRTDGRIRLLRQP